MRTPDLPTLQTMWRYHLGHAYWQSHQLMTIGLYDAPRERVIQYVSFGATNVLLSSATLWLGAMIFPTPHFQELAVAGWIEGGVNLLFSLVALFGVWLLWIAARVARAARRGEDTDACDPLRRATMRRAYRWALEKGWIHEVDGKQIFDRRRETRPEAGPPTERRHGEQPVGTTYYPVSRLTAPPIQKKE